MMTRSTGTSTKRPMKTTTSDFALFFLLLVLGLGLVTHPLTSRTLLVTSINQQPPPFLPITSRPRSDFDPATPVANLSPTQRRELIARLYRADQRYREEVHSGKKRTPEQGKHLNQLMKVNDEANAAILLNLVRAYGWPQSRTAYDSTEFKAYVIVWHISEYARYRQFEPYLPKNVKNQRLIPANPPQSLAEKWRGWK